MECSYVKIFSDYTLREEPGVSPGQLYLNKKPDAAKLSIGLL